ncbi:MAG: TIR domain-containing protein [Nitrososphaerota archaeon]|nr:TIR domain-containing protein [Nitrososphaerota archaeon]
MKYVETFKDPVYGYIEISRNVVSEIINTPTFQRLKHIAPVGFSPLYPSPNHNSFEQLSVFISYRWAQKDFADKLERQIVPHVRVIRDTSSLETWGSLTEFMKRIRNEDFAVLLISDEYLKSINCMFEVSQLMKDDNWYSKVFFVVFDNAKKIYDVSTRDEYLTYWKNKCEKMEAQVKPPVESRIGELQELGKIRDILRNLGDFLVKVGDSKNPPPDDTINEILKRINKSDIDLTPQRLNTYEHSIGVYTLGKIAGYTLTREIKEKVVPSRTVDWDRINEIFSLACLLHDVGHAPFSHAGENFYLKKATPLFDALHNQLFDLVESANFKKDTLYENIKPAAPHEIMSAIVGLKNFSSYFQNTFEKEFFARCITGYAFSKNDEQSNLCNCYIALLNSRVLDVDRLDYLIRDAFFTGFNTVGLDYLYLLSHITVTKGSISGSDDTYRLAFYKGAISVIENFVYAYDSKRKWIQNQPTILYDKYLTQYVISQLDKKFSTVDKKLFSYESISEAGQTLNDGLRVSLLCDDDIISLMKTHCLHKDDLCREYFSRQNRKLPLWETEAEYKVLFQKRLSLNAINDLENVMAYIESWMCNTTDNWLISNESLHKMRTELNTIDKQIAAAKTDAVTKKSLETYRKVQIKVYKVMNCLNEFSVALNIPCDFVILNANRFYSGFDRADFSQINIVFPSEKGEDVRKVMEKITPLSEETKLGTPSNSFFYLFYNHSTDNKFEKETIRDALLDALSRTFLSI